MAKKKAAREFEFAIIAGELKGQRISAPDLGVTRPPLTRLRRSVFDYLWPYLDDATYLDLFSGTGSYLFEAVSRGARQVVGVELEPMLCDAINRQAEQLGIQDRLTCLCDDVLEAVTTLSKKQRRFDIIMMAPPQYVGFIDRCLAKLREWPLTHDRGLIVCQHDTSETSKIDWNGFEVDQRRKYGNTTFTVVRP